LFVCKNILYNCKKYLQITISFRMIIRFKNTIFLGVSTLFLVSCGVSSVESDAKKL
jgi:hypothetical protein